MWEYQDDVGIPYLQAHPRCGLFDEPGLGKTRQLLLAAEGRTLLLAPAMAIAGGVYDEEIEKWAPDLDITVVAYSSMMERKRGPRGGSVPTGRPLPELQGHWDTLICDESHYLKGRKSKWTEATLRIDADRVYPATGTPIPNWAYELFTTLQLLWPEEAKGGGRFGSYWRWAREWFRVGPTHWSPMEVGEPLDATDAGWERFNRENLGDRYLLRRWQDVFDELPELRKQKIECPMRPAQLRAYRELKKQYITFTESGAEINAWSSAGLHTKLQKVTTGLELLDPDSPASGKFDEVREQLRARPDEQVFIAAHFKPTCRELERIVSQELGRSVVRIDGDVPMDKRKALVMAFKTGKVDVMVGSIETVAEAFNFPDVHTVIRVERSYRPSKNNQVWRRIRRVSNLHPKLVIDLVTPKCVDERMIPVLNAKVDQAVKAMPAREYAKLL